MTIRISRLVVRAVAILLASGAGAAVVQAQSADIVASSVTLKRTYLKTGSDQTYIGTDYESIFTPTSVTCDKNSYCLVQVQLAVEVGASSGDQAMVHVAVDGQLPYPLTFGDVVLTYPVGFTDFVGARAFTWAAVVAPGKHTVTVEAQSLTGVIVVGGRTLTISVFK